MEIETEDVAAMRLVGLPHRGPYGRIGHTWMRFMAWVREHGAELAPGARFVSVFHDDASRVPEDELRSHAALTVPGDAETEDEALETIEIPGGRCAVWHHRGSYEGLGQAWQAFAHAVGQAPGFEIEGRRPCFEVYLDDPQHVAPDKLRTDLYIPLVD